MRGDSGAGESAAVPGQVIGGKYELVEIAGVGGMATVWRARQRGPGRYCRTVAVKHMHHYLAERTQYRDMFFEEARIGGVLSDPNIAQVQDFVEEKGELYLVMEWVEGIDLATYNRYVTATSQTTRWELVTAVGIGLLRGLAAAHEHVDEQTGAPVPVLHRDVSPHNVLISVKGPARLIDFGLALASDRMSAPTPPGTAKGKISYLSPEVARGEPATPASDQFSAASVLWESLSGQRCFDGVDDAEVYRKVTTAEVERLSRYRADVPKRLQKIIARAHDPDPANRFPSARAMALELAKVLKVAQAQIDLYALLASTVVDARTALDMGGRTQAPTVEAALPDDESQVVIPLMLRGAWRRLRSRIPFFGGEQAPPRKTAPKAAGTPVPALVRPNGEQVCQLAAGDEVATGGFELRLVATDGPDPSGEPAVELDVTHGCETERIRLEVPGQTVHAGHLLTALSHEDDVLSIRVIPVAVGRALLMFPYVPVQIGELTVEVTGVSGARVFLKLSHTGQVPEHVIVSATRKKPGVVDRWGFRISVSDVSAPWVSLGVEELAEPPFDVEELETFDDFEAIDL